MYSLFSSTHYDQTADEHHIYYSPYYLACCKWPLRNDNQNGFLVPFDDEKSLVDKIQILLHDSDKREEFEKNAIETVKNKFTEDKMIDNVEKFFEENIRWLFLNI